MTLETLQKEWGDDPAYHTHIHDLFSQLTNENPILNAHRTWVEQNVFGFGERSFHFLWKVLLEGLPETPSLLEIGVFRGQSISLWGILRPDSAIFGVTPLDSSDGHWESDYEADIKLIHEKFNLNQPNIIKGLSTDKTVIEQAYNRGPYNVIYVDGGHSREVVDNDLKYYAPMVKLGGFLVIDDACCDMHMPWGFFQGIQPVTDGVLAYIAEHGDKWEFVFSVVHLRIYRRK